ncbi:MAG: low molecular weight protein arginine phosphatase [Candidatus Hodarchaeota archaeon]
MKNKFPYKNILIVCSVNTARSPMAEGFLKDFFSKVDLNVKISSGGIASNARDGMLISMDAKLAMEEVGIKLSERALSSDLKKHPELVEEADLILTLTNRHKEEINRFFNLDSKEILTIKEFAGELGDIEDPSMKELIGFRIARDEIIENLMKGLNQYDF